MVAGEGTVFLRPGSMPQTPVKVLKDALAHLGPYQTLMGVWCIDPGGENTVPLPATIQI